MLGQKLNTLYGVGAISQNGIASLPILSKGILNMVKVSGLKKVMGKLVHAPKGIFIESITTLQNYGNKMVKFARQNHRFETRTGQLERAITANVSKENMSLLFYINPDYVTNGKYNYGAIQHDGSLEGFQKSKFTPPSFNNKNGKGGVRADHFMVNASDEYEEDLIKALRKVVFDNLK